MTQEEYDKLRNSHNTEIWNSNVVNVMKAINSIKNTDDKFVYTQLFATKCENMTVDSAFLYNWIRKIESYKRINEN